MEVDREKVEWEVKQRVKVARKRRRTGRDRSRQIKKTERSSVGDRGQQQDKLPFRRQLIFPAGYSISAQTQTLWCCRLLVVISKYRLGYFW